MTTSLQLSVEAPSLPSASGMSALKVTVCICKTGPVVAAGGVVMV